MKMVIALLFFTVSGEIDPSKTLYFHNLQSCRFLCQQLSREQSKYEPTECICRLTWVEEGTKVIR